MKNVLITGGAGFIGSHLAEHLIQKKFKVHIYDNLSSGSLVNLRKIKNHKNFSFIKGDLLNKVKLSNSLKKIDIVFHLAANADIKNSFKDPSVDFEQNIKSTFFLLEEMRKKNIKNIIFASSSAAIGNPTITPTPEKIFVKQQMSLYGAAKASSEAIISSYCNGYDFKAVALRFVSIVGPRYSHGHIFDFIKKLEINPQELYVLGNGNQRKSYLHVYDCIDAIHKIFEKHFIKNNSKLNYDVYNLGQNTYINIKQSIKIILQTVKLKPKIIYEKSNIGWKGDNPFVFLTNSKIKKLGWKPKIELKKSIKLTAEWINNNKDILKRYE